MTKPRRRPKTVSVSRISLQRATPEREAMAGRDSSIGADGVQRLSDDTLQRLKDRRLLDPDPNRNACLYDAGAALQRFHHGAGLVGYASMDPNRTGGGDGGSVMPATEHIAFCRAKVRRAEVVCGGWNWPVVESVVINGLSLEAAGLKYTRCGDRTAAGAVAKDRLLHGLERLAEDWGYLSRARER